MSREMQDSATPDKGSRGRDYGTIAYAIDKANFNVTIFFHSHLQYSTAQVLPKQ